MDIHHHTHTHTAQKVKRQPREFSEKEQCTSTEEEIRLDILCSRSVAASNKQLNQIKSAYRMKNLAKPSTKNAPFHRQYFSFRRWIEHARKALLPSQHPLQKHQARWIEISKQLEEHHANLSPKHRSSYIAVGRQLLLLSSSLSHGSPLKSERLKSTWDK
jgi:hypothetical protein